MSITKDEVLKIGKLASIKLSEADVKYYVEELNLVLDWVEELQNVDATGVEPMRNVVSVLPELAPSIVRCLKDQEVSLQSNKSQLCDGKDEKEKINEMIIESVCSIPMRKDISRSYNTREQILENATNTKYGYFVVPKIVT